MLPQLARVIVVVALASVALSALPSVKPVHPQSATTPTNATILIAVIADHYTDKQEQEFNYDVENFFKYGLMVDKYYQGKGADLKIVSYFEPTLAPAESRYAFTLGPAVGNCAVAAGTNSAGKTTQQLIDETLAGVSPTHVVVLANHPYNIGCTDTSWTYVAVDAVGTDVLPHEFGHVLADLFDEWSVPANKNKDYTGTILMGDTRNCWPTKDKATKPPHWHGNATKFKNFTDEPECDLFGKKIIHPYKICRMGVVHHAPPEFCPVCAAELDDRFELARDWRAYLRSHRPDGTDSARLQASHEQAPRQGFRIMNAAFVQTPAPAAAKPVPIVQARVEFDVKAGTLRLKERTAATGVYVPNYRRTSEYVYELFRGTTPVDVGVIPGHVFTARGYRGGPVHGTSDEKVVVEFVVPIENETLKSLQESPMRLVIYQIPNDFPGRIITPLNFNSLRSRLKQISEVSVK